MAIPIKTPEEIDAIARAGAVVWGVITNLRDLCNTGVTTREIDAIGAALLADAGATPVLREIKNDRGEKFTGVLCVNVCEQLAHSAPSERILRDGDVVSLDLSASLAGWCADACRSLVVGRETSEASRLVSAARSCLDAGIRACVAGRMWSAVATEIRGEAARLGFSLAPGLGGHGIGRSLHEAPLAWLDPPGPDFLLHPGLVLTIEPIVINAPSESEIQTRVGPDGWAVESHDGSWGACEERTVAISPDGPLILTEGPGRIGVRT